MQRVLLIEPDQETAKLLIIILEECGREAVAVHSLAEATRLLSKTQFDLIVTEAFGQRGPFDFDSSFLDEIRAYAGSTPIILCSTYTPSRAADLGLAAIVAKPFSVDDFGETVSRLLDKTPQTR